jgi:hypothetical protein
METTEDLQSNAVLQSTEIERCKPSISDQGVDVPLDTWAITCVEEYLARLSEGSFAQALSSQRTEGLDQTDTLGEGGADEFACRLLFPDDLLEAPSGSGAIAFEGSMTILPRSASACAWIRGAISP